MLDDTVRILAVGCVNCIFCLFSESSCSGMVCLLPQCHFQRFVSFSSGHLSGIGATSETGTNLQNGSALSLEYSIFSLCG